MSRKETSLFIEEALLRGVESLAVRTGKGEREVFEDALKTYLENAQKARPPRKKARGKYARVSTSSEAFARRKRDEIPLEGERG